MMAAGGGDLQRATRMRLAAHIGHVGQGTRAERRHRHLGGRCPLAAVERGADFQQRARGEGFDVPGDGRFGAVGQRHDQPSAGLRGSQGGRQYAIDAT
ncbi:hypothetical protein GGR60_004272 [Xanthomonas arboricola]|nr:hypothetical protein [Xanthomonas euroxanthea]